ncbi:hypothetical protein A6A27_15665 [Micromonospora sp. CB01531]|nr:hypothetical protein [Micromonospora sp. CB01531]OKI85217.1 hypothetical protein A6A27_15665 [Micromonospora sp. CB01531]
MLDARQVPKVVMADELLNMRDCRFAVTANRSVVGIMSEFTKLAEIYADSARSNLVRIVAAAGHDALQPSVQQRREPRSRTGSTGRLGSTGS